FNLRPPGIELWTTHVPRSYEVALLFLLLGGIYLHRLPELLSSLGLQLDLTQFWQHLGLSLLVLIIPVAFTFAAYKMMQLFYWLANYIQNRSTERSRSVPQESPKSKIQNYNKPRSFVELAYGYLPLVLGGNLAHYLRL
ncbi:MAG: AAA family ATPase, partial [Nostoc sp.]